MTLRATSCYCQRLAGLVVFLLLSACATQVEKPPTTSTWNEHREQLAQLQDWTAYGKVALRSPDSSETGRLTWQQRGEHTEVRLSGPVGVGATIIHSDGSTLDIRRGNEHRVVDVSSPDAIARNTGWDLPLLSLPYWLKGSPAPAPDVEKLELNPDTNTLQMLEQNGWQVQYREYEATDGLALPTRLEISRGDTRARVIIQQWQQGRAQ